MNDIDKKIVALVVTYNRKNLLVESIDALLGQTKSVYKIIVIDNNSTDGTEELFSNGGSYENAKIEFYKMKENLGGAGGFHEGFKLAMEDNNFDYLWIMDDDVIPDLDSLERLLEDSVNLTQHKENFSYLASSVYGLNNEMMNVPQILSAPEHEGKYPDWNEFLEFGLVKIEVATFVSLMIKRDAIAKVGIPIKEYFIWGDDTEYTQRLNKYYGKAYLSGNSKVLHKRKIAETLSLWRENDKNRMGMYIHYFRNNLLNIYRYKNAKSARRMLIHYNIEAIKNISKPNWLYKWKIMQRSIWQYIKTDKKKYFDYTKK